MSLARRARPVVANQQFGTFLGVFTPSVLTILGLVMYLRFGWVVGNVGLGGAILIVLLASSISLATALSASAIATNMRVGAGGEYYMISHSLGLELGGAIGFPLFLCRTLSITFYSYGFAESSLDLWRSLGKTAPAWADQALTAAVILTITAIAGRSASAALKVQVPILMVVGLSVLALVGGVFGGGFQGPEWTPTYRTTDQGFWYVFAVFFPAVTGFAAGIAMSGDLRDPRRSIPRGTLWAVAVGTLVYLIVPTLLATSAALDKDTLAAPGVGAWLELAWLGPWLIYPGIFGAILSSALGSVLGGPRVLQALAADGLAPRFLAKLSKTGQPAVATWLSGGIALAAVALGGLNSVATLVTVLFLTLYLAINLAAGIEQLIQDPSYRPTIQVPWQVSLLGAAGSLAVMFLISPAACIAAAVFELGLYAILRRRSLEKRWGDVRAGLWNSVARYALLKLRNHADDARNWRPHILVFVREPERQIGLVRLASWFNQNRGVVTACRLLEGRLTESAQDIAAARRELEDAVSAAGLVAFSEVNVVKSFVSGAIDVTQANGIAGLQSNTVMFGFPSQTARLADQLRILQSVACVGRSTLIARIAWRSQPGARRRIDLWWGGLESNGDLMLLFAYLLSLNAEWDNARLVVRSVVSSEDQRRGIEKSLEDLIPETRIRATTEIILRQPEETVAQVIHRHSEDADLVLLGLAQPRAGQEEATAVRIFELVEGLPTTILVHNGSAFQGTLV